MSITKGGLNTTGKALTRRTLGEAFVRMRFDPPKPCGVQFSAPYRAGHRTFRASAEGLSMLKICGLAAGHKGRHQE